MSVTQIAPLSRKEPRWSLPKSARRGLFWVRLAHEVWLEAQEMRRIAHARYPFAES